jgi:nucleolar complex protein 3
VKLSKDIRKLREFEMALLSYYLRYLQTLEQYVTKAESLASEEQHAKKVKNAKKSGQDVDELKLKMLESKQRISLGAVATKAMGELLYTHWHFNYRSNIISAVVPLLDSKHDMLAEAAAEAMKSLFRADTKGSGALEAVRAISQLVRGKSYKVRPIAIKTLTTLPLKTELEAGFDIFDEKTQPGSKKHLSQKQRKQRKKDKEMDKELQHAAAEQSMEEKKRMVRQSWYLLDKNERPN